MKLVAWTALVSAITIVAACVGDDPEAPVFAPNPDGGPPGPPGPGPGPSGSDAGSSGGTEAGAATCNGQRFDELKPIDTKAVDGQGAVGFLRPATGGSAFLTLSETGKLPRIARGKLALDTLVLTDAAYVIPNGQTPSASEADVGPVALDDEAFLLYAHVNTEAAGSAYMWISAATQGSPGKFNGGSNKFDLFDGFIGRDGPPSFAGTPGDAALYWGRASTQDAKYRVVRASVEIRAGMEPKINPPTPVDASCPEEKSCGFAVASTSETTMLYASFATSLTPSGFGVHEVALTKTSKTDVKATGARIEHDEIVDRYPSWMSADGCSAIFVGPGGVVFGRRKAK